MARIVVVEDERLFAESIRELLLGRKHQVCLIRPPASPDKEMDLGEVIEKIVAFDPDGVLLDYELGTSFTGLDVNRALPLRLPKVWVINISTYEGEDARFGRYQWLDKKKLYPGSGKGGDLLQKISELCGG